MSSDYYSKKWLFIAILLLGIIIGIIASQPLYLTSLNKDTIYILSLTILVIIFTIGIFDAVNRQVVGPYNLKIIGILLVATFATLIASIGNEATTAAIGILGAIAGYIFGIKDENNTDKK